MADKSYDVVITGGGQKGIVLAMYLTKYGGLSVGLFEERHELGTGWSTEEPSPGWAGNTCSNDHIGIYHTPVYWDFPEWKDYGARYAYTKTSSATVFEEDHTCLAQFSCFPEVDPTQEKTAAHISRFSKRDGDTYLRLWNHTVDKWLPAMQEWIWNPPTPFGQPDAIERLAMDQTSGVDPIWLYQSILQTLSNLFEDPHVQIGFFRTLQSYGFQNDQPAMGFGALLGIFVGNPPHCYAVGGSHSLTHATQRVIYENGGEAWTRKKTDKIIIENGRAKGIRLADGTEVEAKIAVVTDLDPYQLIFELVGPENVSDDIARKVKNLERDWINIHWYSWAFTERPKWKCEEFEPDVWDCMWMCLGDLDLKGLMKESSERKLGLSPSRMYLAVSYMGQSEANEWDQCMAPPEYGFKTLTEQFTVPAYHLTDAEWKKNEREHAEAVVKRINQYAPNITWDKVAGYIPVTPYFTARYARNFAPAGNWATIDNVPSQMGRFRPIPELADHRVPGIEGLYCTGTAWHPYAMAWSPQGYNCYKIMAGDLGLKKTWEGRAF